LNSPGRDRLGSEAQFERHRNLHLAGGLIALVDILQTLREQVLELSQAIVAGLAALSIGPLQAAGIGRIRPIRADECAALLHRGDRRGDVAGRQCDVLICRSTGRT